MAPFVVEYSLVGFLSGTKVVFRGYRTVMARSSTTNEGRWWNQGTRERRLIGHLKAGSDAAASLMERVLIKEEDELRAIISGTSYHRSAVIVCSLSERWFKTGKTTFRLM